MLDHSSAHAILRRLIAGEPLGDGELDRALAHVALCHECSSQFELDRTDACAEVEDDLAEAARLIREGRDTASHSSAVTRHLEECERCRIVLAELLAEEQLAETNEVRVDPAALRERALVGALDEPDPIMRERAAERLGTFERLGLRALAGLAEAAGGDPDEDVRAAALRALDELDAQVSIPERVLEAWAAAPAEWAPFIESVFARVADEGTPLQGVTELVGTAVPGELSVMIAGSAGIRGQLTKEASELRLSLEGLPANLEHARLVVAIPRVLEEVATSIEWPAKDPGLVPVPEAVRAGSLKVILGRLAKDAPAEKRGLFERMYLLNPEARRGQPPGRS